jgi:hypothetical protein
MKAVLLILLVFILFKLYKYLKTDKSEKKDDKQLADEINSYASKGKKLSYDLSNYKSFADTIYSAISAVMAGDLLTGDWAGADEDTIFQIFRKMKNDADVIQLEKSFGKREYVGGWDGGLLDFGTFPNESLSVQLAKELSAKQLNIINKDFIKKGIKRRY